MFAKTKQFKKLKSQSLSHLQEVNMTYFQHLKHAHSLGCIFIKHGIQTYIHGLFPEIFKKSAIDGIYKLNYKYSNQNSPFVPPASSNPPNKPPDSD